MEFYRVLKDFGMVDGEFPMKTIKSGQPNLKRVLSSALSGIRLDPGQTDFRLVKLNLN